MRFFPTNPCHLVLPKTLWTINRLILDLVYSILLLLSPTILLSPQVILALIQVHCTSHLLYLRPQMLLGDGGILVPPTSDQ